MEEAEKCRAKLPKIKEKLNEAEVRRSQQISFTLSVINSYIQVKYVQAEDDILAAEKKVEDLGDIEHLHQRRRDINERLTNVKKQLTQIRVRGTSRHCRSHADIPVRMTNER